MFEDIFWGLEDSCCLMVLFFLCGPVAICLGFICLSKIKTLGQQIEKLQKKINTLKPTESAGKFEAAKGVEVIPDDSEKTQVEKAIDSVSRASVPKPEGGGEVSGAKDAGIEEVSGQQELSYQAGESEAEEVKHEAGIVFAKAQQQWKPAEARLDSKQKRLEKKGTFEENVGTRWILFAGIIAVMVGVGFFLKYAYEQAWFGPVARVLMVAGFGFAALVIGEVTRKFGYDIVAKGVTALGFGLLYASVFAAYRRYDLISSGLAIGLSIVITAGAMFDAVMLNEVLMAILALVGGFLSPVLIWPGDNVPGQIFAYVLVLGLGSIGCAWYRRWRVVNLVSFAGTFVIYGLWFYRFFNEPLARAVANEQVPEQMAVAIGWLGVFFLVYHILPVLYSLVRKVIADKLDVLLVVLNAGVVFYYLYMTLYEGWRKWLALGCFVLFLIHLGMMALVYARNKQDVNLRVSLLAVGLLFLTVTMPFFFNMYALAVAWAAQGLLLAVVGSRYRSFPVRAASIIAILLSIIQLVNNMPMHEDEFRFLLNSQFCSWLFVFLVIYACHLIYRFNGSLEKDVRTLSSQLCFAVAGLVLLAGAMMEWYWHCDLNLGYIGDRGAFLAKGYIVALFVMMILFVARPVRPGGIIVDGCGLVFVGGSVVAAGWLWARLHDGAFRIFVNTEFGVLLLPLIAMIVYQVVYRSRSDEPDDEAGTVAQWLYIVMGGYLLFAVAREWYLYCDYSVDHSDAVILMGMNVIISAVLPLFVLRPICPRGLIGKVMALLLVVYGAYYMIDSFGAFHEDAYLIVLNKQFWIAMLYVASLFLVNWLVRREESLVEAETKFWPVFATGAVVVLWILVSMEIYYYWKFRAVNNWRFLSQMCISIMWAAYGAILMIIGFWRNLRLIRFSALGLFAALLIKVFIVDTKNIDTIYRIVSFLVVGLTLVGVSYLYQYLKMKGFFDTLIAQSQKEKVSELSTGQSVSDGDRESQNSDVGDD